MTRPPKKLYYLALVLYNHTTVCRGLSAIKRLASRYSELGHTTEEIQDPLWYSKTRFLLWFLGRIVRLGRGVFDLGNSVPFYSVCSD